MCQDYFPGILLKFFVNFHYILKVIFKDHLSMPAFKNNYVDNTVGKYNIFSFHPLLVPKTKFQTVRKTGTTSL